MILFNIILCAVLIYIKIKTHNQDCTVVEYQLPYAPHSPS